MTCKFYQLLGRHVRVQKIKDRINIEEGTHQWKGFDILHSNLQPSYPFSQITVGRIKGKRTNYHGELRKKELTHLSIQCRSPKCCPVHMPVGYRYANYHRENPIITNEAKLVQSSANQQRLAFPEFETVTTSECKSLFN